MSISSNQPMEFSHQALDCQWKMPTGATSQQWTKVSVSCPATGLLSVIGNQPSHPNYSHLLARHAMAIWRTHVVLNPPNSNSRPCLNTFWQSTLAKQQMMFFYFKKHSLPGKYNIYQDTQSAHKKMTNILICWVNGVSRIFLNTGIQQIHIWVNNNNSLTWNFRPFCDDSVAVRSLNPITDHHELTAKFTKSRPRKPLKKTGKYITISLCMGLKP